MCSLFVECLDLLVASALDGYICKMGWEGGVCEVEDVEVVEMVCACNMVVCVRWEV